MNRRQFITTAGAATAGTTLAVGSGAFSQSQVQRSVTVQVADDAEAYLALLSQSGIAQGQPERLDFDISDTTLPRAKGQGVGTGSVYSFVKGDGVFSAQNRGTNDVVLYGESLDDGTGIDVRLVQAEDEGMPVLTEDSPSEICTPGDVLFLGLEIDTRGAETVDKFETGVRIVAEEP